jgi:hypothetical protein
LQSSLGGDEKDGAILWRNKPVAILILIKSFVAIPTLNNEPFAGFLNSAKEPFVANLTLEPGSHPASQLANWKTNPLLDS